MPTPAVKIDPNSRITSADQLLAFFRSGLRPAEKWAVGAEMETLVVDGKTGEAADFPRIEALLSALAATGQWTPVYENDHVIGLLGQHSSVTLEPGGQIELSGRLCTDLACNYDEFFDYVTDITREAGKLGLLFLGLGTQPFTPLTEIDWVPKHRYAIMGPYMNRCGTQGQRMMKQSAGLQVNLDYSDEADCMDKLRLAQALSPLLYALFANSPVLEGRKTGFLSTRGHIWAHTDPDRTGFLDFLFSADAGFGDYVEYALDVPMYFIVREGRYLDLTERRFTFRNYLDQGFGAHRATQGDWNLHLSTLFTEVRLRPQIEMRSADSLPASMSLMVAGLLKGLFYDQAALAAAWDLCRPNSGAELRAGCEAAWDKGLQAVWQGRTLQETARICLELSRAGLARESCRWARDRNEAVFLNGLEQIIESGQTMAERLLQDWHGSRSAKLAALTRHCAFPGDLAPSRDVPCAYAGPEVED
ncbi:MAG TPA: glutamate-cysteine ligase family protein [Desulfuromonadales bacterium]|nr:glutamate-cysteine ligase family protein [Desulfuromonadales bacterium]